jgi:heme exporter protein D
MNWGSFDAFVSMGGYGLYVWGSYAACVVALVVELVQLAARRRDALRGVARVRLQQGRNSDEASS